MKLKKYDFAKQETEQRGREAADDQVAQGEGGGEEEHDVEERETEGERDKETSGTGEKKL